MNLSPEETKLYYKLMWSLQYYIKLQGGLLNEITTLEEYTNLPSEKKFKVRSMLWDNPKLIDAYLQENPEGFSSAELEIVRKWKSFVKGSFYILRHLKKYSIFMGNNNQVYAVVGLLSPLEDVVPSYSLPLMVDAVLLPFKGLIIYDGMFNTYNIMIGGGIRTRLNHTYMVAKQKERIIVTLEPELAEPQSAAPKRTKDLLPKLGQVVSQMSALKGDTPLQNAAISHARASLDLAILLAQEPEDLSKLKSAHRKLSRAAARLNNLLEIEENE
jgi:hypothetical protein